MPPPSGSFCGRGRGWRSMTWTAAPLGRHMRRSWPRSTIACGRGPWKHLPARGHVSEPGATRFFCGGGGWRGEPRALIPLPRSWMACKRRPLPNLSTPGPSLFARLFVSGTVFFAVIFSFHPYRRKREREGVQCSNYDTVPTTEHEGQCRRPWIDPILVELAGFTATYGFLHCSAHQGRSRVALVYSHLCGCGGSDPPLIGDHIYSLHGCYLQLGFSTHLRTGCVPVFVFVFVLANEVAAIVSNSLAEDHASADRSIAGPTQPHT